MRTASDRLPRWLAPPPARTAAFSRARRPGVVLRVSRIRHRPPAAAAASAWARVRVAMPDRWPRKLSADRSPVRTDRSGPLTVPSRWPAASVSPSAAAQVTVTAGSSWANTSLATAVPARTPDARATKCPVPAASAGMSAVEVRSPRTPRSSARARATASRTALTGGSKSPVTSSSFPLRDGHRRRDPHPPVGPEVHDALQRLPALGEVEPVVAPPGLVPFGGGGDDGPSDREEIAELRDVPLRRAVDGLHATPPVRRLGRRQRSLDGRDRGNGAVEAVAVAQDAGEGGHVPLQPVPQRCDLQLAFIYRHIVGKGTPIRGSTQLAFIYRHIGGKGTPVRRRGILEGDAAHGAGGLAGRPAGGDGRGHPVAEDQAFEEGVGGQAVGAMDPGAGHLAAGPQAGEGGGAVDVGHDAAAEVVGGRRHRQP